MGHIGGLIRGLGYDVACYLPTYQMSVLADSLRLNLCFVRGYV
jgi:hypothetical protein